MNGTSLRSKLGILRVMLFIGAVLVLAVVNGHWFASMNGISDLAIANSQGNTVTVLLGLATGGFVSVPGSPIAVRSKETKLASSLKRTSFWLHYSHGDVHIRLPGMNSGLSVSHSFAVYYSCIAERSLLLDSARLVASLRSEPVLSPGRLLREKAALHALS